LVDPVPIEDVLVDAEVELGYKVNTVLLDVIVLVIGLLKVSATELILNIINISLIKHTETLTYQSL
jgi:hypothetical protein